MYCAECAKGGINLIIGFFVRLANTCFISTPRTRSSLDIQNQNSIQSSKEEDEEEGEFESGKELMKGVTKEFEKELSNIIGLKTLKKQLRTRAKSLCLEEYGVLEKELLKMIELEELKEQLQTWAKRFLLLEEEKDEEEEKDQPHVAGKKSDNGVLMEELEEELSNIIGLEDLKQQLRTWAKGLLLDYRRQQLGINVGARKPPLMVFLGNPGTGKTMVARILGRLLHNLGLLSSDKVVEVQRTDLVAEYTGQTGKKTKAKIDEAEGGTLFVDEAYQLIVPTDKDDYGLEALEEIMSVMDGGKLSIIFAGYREPMQRVLASNEGFRRRIDTLFIFDNYSCEELAKILDKEMTKKGSKFFGFKLEPSCSLNVIAVLIKKMTTEEQRNKMNAGIVDQMLTKARENLDRRLPVDCADRNLLVTITLKDLEVSLESLNKNQAIGFDGIKSPSISYYI